ncbi:MAG: hypothetical protein LQ340_007894 [Diploschistes diacapsis]|nr:MAG: hypothetical protein LQ340_007894 [Diploschistes diacapsis]
MAPIIINSLIVRDGSMSGGNATTFYLLIVLAVLLSIGFAALCALLVLKHIHRKREQQSLACVEKAQSKSHRRSRHPPSISITTEKTAFLETDSAPPSPVPEIRITFPDEEGHDNKLQSGRVVVVRISEKGGIGLEPYEDQLPAYQKEDGYRFQSLDLERIGGLKEKEQAP